MEKSNASEAQTKVPLEQQTVFDVNNNQEHQRAPPPPTSSQSPALQPPATQELQLPKRLLFSIPSLSEMKALDCHDVAALSLFNRRKPTTATTTTTAETETATETTKENDRVVSSSHSEVVEQQQQRRQPQQPEEQSSSEDDNNNKDNDDDDSPRPTKRATNQHPLVNSRPDAAAASSASLAPTTVTTPGGGGGGGRRRIDERIDPKRAVVTAIGKRTTLTTPKQSGNMLRMPLSFVPASKHSKADESPNEKKMGKIELMTSPAASSRTKRSFPSSSTTTTTTTTTTTMTTTTSSSSSAKPPAVRAATSKTRSFMQRKSPFNNFKQGATTIRAQPKRPRTKNPFVFDEAQDDESEEGEEEEEGEGEGEGEYAENTKQKRKGRTVRSNNKAVTHQNYAHEDLNENHRRSSASSASSSSSSTFRAPQLAPSPQQKKSDSPSVVSRLDKQSVLRFEGDNNNNQQKTLKAYYPPLIPTTPATTNAKSPSVAKFAVANATTTTKKKTPNGKRVSVSVSFQVISKDRFGTSKAVRNPVLDKILQSFATSGIKNPEDRTWSFPLSLHDALVDHLKHYHKGDIDLSVTGVPSDVLKFFATWKKTCNQSESYDLTSIPFQLLHQLLPFQLQGVLYAIEKQGRIMIADEMGLGKTLQAITIACYFREDWPLLVIAPSSVKGNWAKELVKWVDWLSEDDINVVKDSKNILGSMVNIVSYDLIPKLASALKDRAFQCIIADESHYLKNVEAKRTKATLPFLKSSARTILLTGTPALSRPAELYSQLSALNIFERFGIYKNFKSFALRYCAAYQGKYGWDYTGNSNLQELHAILQQQFMIRRLKKDVLKGLPKKTRQQVFIDARASLSDEIVFKMNQLNGLESLAKSSKHLNEKQEALTARNQMLTELYGATARAKMDAVKEYVVRALQVGDKFVVFGHHKEMLDALESCLRSEQRKNGGKEYIRIDGSTESSKRQALVNQFQTDPNCLVALLSMTAAGQGITLNKASFAIFAELFWTPGVLLQAEDRIHRIGQDTPVLIHYLVAKNTLDDRIWPILSSKLEVLGEALNGEEEQLEAEAAVALNNPRFEDSSIIDNDDVVE